MVKWILMIPFWKIKKMVIQFVINIKNSNVPAKVPIHFDSDFDVFNSYR